MSDNPSDQRRLCTIAEYIPLIKAADGLTLSQVCTLSSLEATTIQNWIKRGYVPHPVGKKYRERHLARILLISELRESMPIDRVGALLRFVNGDTDDESDDIITEERLYDAYHELTEQLTACRFDRDRTGEITQKVVAGIPDIPEDDRVKITNALLVMANVYTASCYMREANDLFVNTIKGV